MSAITSDSAPYGIETPARQSGTDGKKYSRKAEFRSALDSYIADYSAYQKRRADMIGTARPHYIHCPGFARLAEWLLRQVAVCRDWASAPTPARAPSLPESDKSVSLATRALKRSQDLDDNASDVSDLLPPDTLWLGG
jgi:hypothetical protein